LIDNMAYICVVQTWRIVGSTTRGHTSTTWRVTVLDSSWEVATCWPGGPRLEVVRPLVVRCWDVTVWSCRGRPPHLGGSNDSSDTNSVEDVDTSLRPPRDGGLI